MELILPCKCCLACCLSTWLLLHFQKRRGYWSLWKDQFQAQEDQVLWPASTGNRGRPIPPMNWWTLLFSEVGCLEWGTIPVSRVGVPYTRVTLCEHTSHSDTVAGFCAEKFPGSTINPSLAHLTGLWDRSKVALSSYGFMDARSEGQRCWGSGTFYLSWLDWGETCQICHKETFRLSFSRRSRAETPASTLTAGTAEICRITSCGYLYQLRAGFEWLDIPLHTHEAGSSDLWAVGDLKCLLECNLVRAQQVLKGLILQS